MKSLKTIISVVLSAALILSVFSGCGVNFGSNDIVILFSGGVGNEAASGVGYSGVSAYKRSVSVDHRFVTLVDCGDSLSGGSMDLVSKGAFASRLMNEVDYDFYNLGGKDLSLGAEGLSALKEDFGAKIISSNIFAENDDSIDIASYATEQFASRSVAFVGVSAPAASSDGFSVSSGDELAEDVRSAVKLAAEADYTVLISNLGFKGTSELISKLSGVDAALDVNASPVAERLIKDESGKSVVYSSAGNKLQTIGQLVISSSGTITSTNVSIDEKDEDVELLIESLDKEYSSKLDEVIATAEQSVTSLNSSGIRIVENREAPIGDLIADAYASAAKADIALVSADEIAEGLRSGDVSVGSILSAIPGGRTVAAAEITGQQLIDALEFAVKNVSGYYASNGQPFGTFAGFLQVSGISFSVNTNLSSSVSVNDKGELEKIGSTRRIVNAKAKNADGELENIDPEATYTVAGSLELLSGESNGNKVFADAKIINEEVAADYSAVIDFIRTELKGDLSDYYSTNGRINIY